jgi:hypothetical protein
VIGTENKKKTYKNLVDFTTKFMGKDIKLDDDGKLAQFDIEKNKVKATGLKLIYTDKNKNNRKTKLKVNKDYSVILQMGGLGSTVSKSGALKKDKLDPTAFFTNNNEVVTMATITVVGRNNYCGVITKANVVIPMEIQTVTAAGQAYKNGLATVTYGGVNETNVYDNFSIDNLLMDENSKKVPQKLSASQDKDAIAKLLKIKADGNLKVDKEGYIIVKKVPQDQKGKITISAKRNNKSVDASYDLEFKIEKATITSANIRFDTNKVEGKAFKDKEAAKKAAEKITIFANVNGKDIKLKAGSNKDFSSIVADQERVLDGSTMTGPSLKFNLSANLVGNYTGTLKDTVNCTAKK